MAAVDQMGTFMAALTGVVVIGFSCVIAFFVTCFGSLFVTGRLASTFDADMAIRTKYSMWAAIAWAAAMAIVLAVWRLRIALRPERR